MYLSRMFLDIDGLAVAGLIGSPYQLHADIQRTFSSDEESQTEYGRILWRVDVSPRHDKSVVVYVVSPEAPKRLGSQRSDVHQKFRSLTNFGVWETKAYTPLLQRIREGQMYQFRLKANTVRKVWRDHKATSGKGLKGTLQGHVRVEQQKKWLLDRATPHGFAIVQGNGDDIMVDVSQSRKEEFWKKRFEKGSRPVTLSTAVFNGVLCVTDANSFRKTLSCGLGRAKGFGCGLLTVVPLPVKYEIER